MQRKVFFKQNPLFLTDSLTAEIGTLQQTKKSFTVENLEAEAIERLISFLNREQNAVGIILHQHLEESYNALLKHFNLIKAAGGLVYTPDKEILLIFRRGIWDLPKGKLDEGEDLERCALREVKEETGLTDLELKAPLLTTYHTYSDYGSPMLKESHWYTMLHKEKQPLVPQAEEEIQKCEWVKPDNLAPYLEHAHASIREVIAAARDKL